MIKLKRKCWDWNTTDEELLNVLQPITQDFFRAGQPERTKGKRPTYLFFFVFVFCTGSFAQRFPCTPCNTDIDIGWSHLQFVTHTTGWSGLYTRWNVSALVHCVWEVRASRGLFDTCRSLSVTATDIIIAIFAHHILKLCPSETERFQFTKPLTVDMPSSFYQTSFERAAEVQCLLSISCLKC